jgi:4-hydroxymandelate oxidase
MLSLHELESEARRQLDAAVYDFIAGGADDEITLRANETAFARIGLIPRVLCGKGVPELAVDLLDCQAAMPVLIAPTAFHRLVDPQGERAAARAAAAAGIIMIASMASTVAIEEVASAAGEAVGSGPAPDLWFQLYIQPDLGFTEAIVHRAEAAGCKVLVISVDSPAFGQRERDVRNGFRDLPAGMYCENLRIPGAAVEGRPRDIVFSPDLSWEHIDWLRKTTRLKIALKGLVHPRDARLAADAGVDAILVSNHGGRQLDTVPPAIELLPAIANELGGRLPVLVDGGIRRGTDIVKAIALGAAAVAVGRPVLWGLAVGGESGVAQVLGTLRLEFARALTLCGCGSVSDISRDLVRFPAREELWYRTSA